MFHHVSELRSNRVACNLNTLHWEIDHAADTVVCEATSTKGTLKLAQCISISSSRICQRQLSKASALDLPGSARLVNMREKLGTSATFRCILWNKFILNSFEQLRTLCLLSSSCRPACGKFWGPASPRCLRSGNSKWKAGSSGPIQAGKRQGSLREFG